MITEDWAREIREEHKQLIHNATEAEDKAMYDCQMLESLHRQSRESWEKRMTEIESSNKKHLIKINELLNEKAEWLLTMETVSAKLKEVRNTVVLAAAKLRKDNLTLSEENERPKAERSLPSVMPRRH